MKDKTKAGRKHAKSVLTVVATIVILLPYVLYAFEKMRFDKTLKETARAAFILVDKEELMITVFNYNGDEVFKSGISCGKNYGDKRVVGDLKTPEGVFRVCDIQDASDWGHDFKDGNGWIEGAYGSTFIRLEVPGHKGIGIHGTHKPESIGTRDTEGCIRLENSELLKLKEFVYVGMVVVVSPSAEDAVITKKKGNYISVDAK